MGYIILENDKVSNETLVLTIWVSMEDMDNHYSNTNEIFKSCGAS
jgi:hypothetical protein